MAKQTSTIKLYYVGKLRQVHAGVGGVKYHFTAATGFCANVQERHARTLLRTGNYMPAGTEGARLAAERARRLAPAKATRKAAAVQTDDDAGSDPAGQTPTPDTGDKSNGPSAGDAGKGGKPKRKG